MAESEQQQSERRVASQRPTRLISVARTVCVGLELGALAEVAG